MSRARVILSCIIQMEILSTVSQPERHIFQHRGRSNLQQARDDATAVVQLEQLGHGL